MLTTFLLLYYNYLAGTNGDDLKVSFSKGSVYQKSLAGKEFPINNLGTIVGNGSYTVRIKLMTNPLYLYDNGTIGIYEERGTRTPIGIMITEKTRENAGPGEEGAGLAIALKDATIQDSDGDIKDEFELNIDNSERAYTAQEGNDNIECAKFMINDLRGYFWTWDKNGSLDKTTIKGETKESYYGAVSGFYAAGQFSPGVAVTGNNVSKWFLPSAGQAILALKKLKVAEVKLSDFGHDNGDGTKYAYYQFFINDRPFNVSFARDCFTKAGGEFPIIHDVRYYTSTQTGAYNPGGYLGIVITIGYDIAGTYRRDYESCRIRPFVHF